MLWYGFYGHPIGYLSSLGCSFAPKYPGERRVSPFPYLPSITRPPAISWDVGKENRQSADSSQPLSCLLEWTWYLISTVLPAPQWVHTRNHKYGTYSAIFCFASPNKSPFPLSLLLWISPQAGLPSFNVIVAEDRHRRKVVHNIGLSGGVGVLGSGATVHPAEVLMCV